MTGYSCCSSSGRRRTSACDSSSTWIGSSLLFWTRTRPSWKSKARTLEPSPSFPPPRTPHHCTRASEDSSPERRRRRKPPNAAAYLDEVSAQTGGERRRKKSEKFCSISLHGREQSDNTSTCVALVWVWVMSYLGCGPLWFHVDCVFVLAEAIFSEYASLKDSTSL